MYVVNYEQVRVQGTTSNGAQLCRDLGGREQMRRMEICALNLKLNAHNFLGRAVVLTAAQSNLPRIPDIATAWRKIVVLFTDKLPR